MDEASIKRIIALRRLIHKHPELAFNEKLTAEAIAEHLDKLGIKHKSGLAGTGVVGRIDSGRPGPVIALRADMDALPIEEKQGSHFRSCVAGVMHACGHDGHVAMLVGAAGMLAKKGVLKSGSVVLIFQPAEEAGGGGRKLVELGVMEGVDMIFAGHLDLHYKTGRIAIRTGVETSYTDELVVQITGRGAHAAYPHESVDSVLVASQFVIAMQSIVARNTSPLIPSVITIGALHAGSACNAIADSAILRGTIRNTDTATRKEVIRRIRQSAKALADMHGARISVKVIDGYPPVINHPEGFAIAHATATRLLGARNVSTLDKPSMGGEDFAYYLKKARGCFVRFGAAGKAHAGLKAHSPEFDFDEGALKTGAEFLANVTLNAIARLSTARRAR